MNLSIRTTASRHVAARAAAGALIAATLLTAGCATVKTETAEETVARRANERWQALIKGDFTAAYRYLQPGYRAIVNEQNYRKTFGAGGAWKAADIYTTTCEAERCTVRLRLTTLNFAPGFATKMPEIQNFFNETWIKDEGQWWFYQAPATEGLGRPATP